MLEGGSQFQYDGSSLKMGGNTNCSNPDINAKSVVSDELQVLTFDTTIVRTAISPQITLGLNLDLLIATDDSSFRCHQ